jgi:glyoxylase-like metal-dependent hydrolase (beta-lactamase superfamily II)
LPSGIDAVGIRADNPGPFSLTGTNSWIAGRDPAWLIDPGPLLAAHTERLAREIASRGGLRGIALTHDHPDHDEAVPAMLERFPGALVIAARGQGRRAVGDGDSVGPLEVLATPGHSPDHLAYLFGAVAFTGDAVLGEGSVFVAPDPGSLAAYLAALERLRERRPLALAPGHGPVVLDADAKLSEYRQHRLERERRLVAALEHGARTVDAMLDVAWSDVPASLRPAAAITLAAHLDKLADEGRLPAGVERPQWPVPWLSHV